MTRPLSILVVISALSAGCASTADGRLSLPAPDEVEFDEQVYPILLRDCGFSGCHGDHGRFFQVFGPGRVRLSEEVFPYDPPTAEEIRQSYDRARSMLVNERSIYDSVLLRKPLATAAGGAGHEGEDAWGRNVYATRDDPAYLAIARWALRSAAQQTHTEQQP